MTAAAAINDVGSWSLVGWQATFYQRVYDVGPETYAPALAVLLPVGGIIGGVGGGLLADRLGKQGKQALLTCGARACACLILAWGRFPPRPHPWLRSLPSLTIVATTWLVGCKLQHVLARHGALHAPMCVVAAIILTTACSSESSAYLRMPGSCQGHGPCHRNSVTHTFHATIRTSCSPLAISSVHLHSHRLQLCRGDRSSSARPGGQCIGTGSVHQPGLPAGGLCPVGDVARACSRHGAGCVAALAGVHRLGGAPLRAQPDRRAWSPL